MPETASCRPRPRRWCPPAARIETKRDLTHVVGPNRVETCGKDHAHSVGNVHKQRIHADRLIETGRNREETVPGTHILNVKQSITDNRRTHTLMPFGTFVIEGQGGKIALDATGIMLAAALVRLKGMVKMGGGAPGADPDRRRDRRAAAALTSALPEPLEGRGRRWQDSAWKPLPPCPPGPTPPRASSRSPPAVPLPIW